MKTPQRMHWAEFTHAMYAGHRAYNHFQCTTCNRPIALEMVPLSIHTEALINCAGGGMVLWVDIPYCQNCEEKPGPGCLHMPYTPLFAVHILHAGFAMCRFMNAAPNEWPDGHRWVYPIDSNQATCARCVALFAK